MTADLQPRLDTIAAMAEHKGACEALLAAARLLRATGHRDAADVLLDNVPALVPEVETLPANAGEGEA